MGTGNSQPPHHPGPSPAAGALTRRLTVRRSKRAGLLLTGGPGHSNVDFQFASRYTDDRDFVLVGYRGVDGSVRLDCP
jgi:hypothetical protein